MILFCRNGKLEHINSKDVRVGDIIAVKNKDKFPCDLIILATSSLKGKCYVMTANLDGESNLKAKLAVRETRKYMNVSFLNNLSGKVECQTSEAPVRAAKHTNTGKTIDPGSLMPARHKCFRAITI